MPHLDPKDRSHLERHLGKALDDVVEIPVRAGDGAPRVATVHPLRIRGGDHEPCTTLYWLCDPELRLALSRLEAGGAVRHFEARLQGDGEARARYHAQHRDYAAARLARLGPEELELARERGWMETLSGSGIGGLRNPDAVKCLHLHYAHHLVGDNVIGAWTDALLHATST